MRVDDYLSTVGIVKRRTVAKELGAGGKIEINGKVVKPAHQVKVGDIIQIRGSRPLVAEILAIPVGSVPRANRGDFFRLVNTT